MTVRRKPTAPKNVEEFIHAAKTDKNGNEGEVIHPVKLRIPDDLLSRIDAAVGKRRPAPSRHQWILEALYEKLERDN